MPLTEAEINILAVHGNPDAREMARALQRVLALCLTSDEEDIITLDADTVRAAILGDSK